MNKNGIKMSIKIMTKILVNYFFIYKLINIYLQAIYKIK